MYRSGLIRVQGLCARAFSASSTRPVCVIGGGQMGSGIAAVSSSSSFASLPTIVYDINPLQLEKAKKYISDYYHKEQGKGRLSAEQVSQSLSRLSFSSSLDALSSPSSPSSPPFIVIEAATENVQLKCNIFKDLASRLPLDTILATNTSSISISKLAGTVPSALCPSRVIGMHFMNPVPVMKLVEVIPALQTDQGTIEATLALAKQMGKTTTMSRDIPGFIANRLLMPYLNEAIYALQEGLGTREDIDTTMKLGCSMPMGPLQLADFIGLDTCLAIMQVLHEGLGDSKYRASPLLQQYVDAGFLGKKTGRGFYTY